MQNPSAGKTALGLDANVGAGLCYVGNLVCALGLIYSIIVIVTDKTNKLPRFHAFQSIMLLVVNLVVCLPGYMIMVAMFAIGSTLTSIIGALVGLIVMVVGLAIFVFFVISAIKAFQGQIYKVPVIGTYADNFSN